jgi:DNA-binding GntR family transcriptional regulator
VRRHAHAAALPEQVAEKIEGLIRWGLLLPGEQLEPRHLGEHWDASPTSVYRGIKLAQARGPVVTWPGVGSFVASFVADEAASLQPNSPPSTPQ